MKTTYCVHFFPLSLILVMGILLYASPAYTQMHPPGYERAMKEKQAQMAIPPLDRDSVTLVDTTEIFDPTTNENETKIIISRYSLRDYCKQNLGMNNPDILLDNKPHTIIDPKTYEDMIIRLNASGKIDTLPK
jgi:hypothetical protein